jgi:hypothetical protein
MNTCFGFGVIIDSNMSLEVYVENPVIELAVMYHILLNVIQTQLLAIS